MIPIKTKEEIAIMTEGGKKLGLVMKEVLAGVEPGVMLSTLDKLAESLIIKAGGQSSFKMVKGYHWATCININQGVVHGIPGDYRIKSGDLFSVDIGLYYRGFHTDMARTVWMQNPKSCLPAGRPDILNPNFLEAGEKALKEAIRVVKQGNYLGQISRAIEQVIRQAGYEPVKELTGHGVGKNLHEEPMIPGFLAKDIRETPILKTGMTLAIEVIYAQKKPDLVIKDDGWTIETEDGSLAGLFEDTIAISGCGIQNLTGFN
jgi:methionyl aminopeptidase